MARRHSISVTHRQFAEQAKRLRELAGGIRYFAPEFQVLASEMITLQAFYCFESAIEEMACKIVCGARYVDGAIPTLLHKAGSIDDAATAMRTLNRTKAKAWLKWSQAKVITENVEHVMDPAENFCTVCTAFANEINDVRRVRNHIAHFNKDISLRTGRRVPDFCSLSVIASGSLHKREARAFGSECGPGQVECPGIIHRCRSLSHAPRAALLVTRFPLRNDGRVWGIDAPETKQWCG